MNNSRNALFCKIEVEFFAPVYNFVMFDSFDYKIDENTKISSDACTSTYSDDYKFKKKLILHSSNIYFASAMIVKK